MKSYESITIEKATKEECNIVSEILIKYNNLKVPFTQENPFTSMNFVIKNSLGKIIGGVLGTLYLWNILEIHVISIEEEYRGEGYGVLILNTIESKAKSLGCTLIHLDTFDFQAKDFYEKYGYKVFGVLEDCPEDHKRYYMRKKLV